MSHTASYKFKRSKSGICHFISILLVSLKYLRFNVLIKCIKVIINPLTCVILKFIEYISFNRNLFQIKILFYPVINCHMICYHQ